MLATTSIENSVKTGDENNKRDGAGSHERSGDPAGMRSAIDAGNAHHRLGASLEASGAAEAGDEGGSPDQTSAASVSRQDGNPRGEAHHGRDTSHETINAGETDDLRASQYHATAMATNQSVEAVTTLAAGAGEDDATSSKAMSVMGTSGKLAHGRAGADGEEAQHNPKAVLVTPIGTETNYGGVSPESIRAPVEDGSKPDNGEGAHPIPIALIEQRDNAKEPFEGGDEATQVVDSLYKSDTGHHKVILPPLESTLESLPPKRTGLDPAALLPEEARDPTAAVTPSAPPGVDPHRTPGGSLS